MPATMTLPKYAKAIEPVSKKLGGYVAMEYDAKLTRRGVDWYRCKDGMGQRGDREDWVADLPGCSVSVNDYNWNGKDFGPSFKSFEDALDGMLKMALHHHEVSTQEKREKLAVAEATLERLTAAVEEMPEGAGECTNGKWQ